MELNKPTEDQFDYPKKVVIHPKDEYGEDKPVKKGLSERVSFVVKEGITKEPIDLKFAPSKKVSEIEAVMLRQLYRREKVEELVELLTGVEPAVLDKVLSGLYWPYAGELLKPSKQGPLAKGTTTDIRMFGRCVIEIAVETLDADDIDILCRMLGVEGDTFTRAISAIRTRSQADVKQYLKISYRTQVNKDYRSRSLHGSY